MNPEQVATLLKLGQTLSEQTTTDTDEPLRNQLIDQTVLIRAVTMTQVGRVEAVDAELIELSDASWVANTGRFADALRTGELSEVEPFGDRPVWVQRSSIVDITTWDHPLPTEQK